MPVAVCIVGLAKLKGRKVEVRSPSAMPALKRA
jgi:hypothetical protein